MSNDWSRRTSPDITTISPPMLTLPCTTVPSPFSTNKAQKPQFIPFDEDAVHPRLRGRGFLVSTKNRRDLWRDSIFWPAQNILFVFSANPSDLSDLMGNPWTQTSGVEARAQKIGSGQRSRFLVLIKRSAPSGYENYRRASFGQQQESRPLTGYEFSEQAQSTHFVISANQTFIFLPMSVNRCWPKGTRDLGTIMIQESDSAAQLAEWIFP